MTTWRNNGSDHYKTGGVEPIDLYAAAGNDKLAAFCLCSIIKYAFRQMNAKGVNEADLKKIETYAAILREKVLNEAP
jgi:hypothetical protein